MPRWDMTDDDELEMAKHVTPQRLAKLMREWRTARGLSVADAGKVLALSPRTIEGIEQERGFAAARVLEIALQHLITET